MYKQTRTLWTKSESVCCSPHASPNSFYKNGFDDQINMLLFDPSRRRCKKYVLIFKINMLICSAQLNMAKPQM